MKGVGACRLEGKVTDLLIASSFKQGWLGLAEMLGFLSDKPEMTVTDGLIMELPS